MTKTTENTAKNTINTDHILPLKNVIRWIVRYIHHELSGEGDSSTIHVFNRTRSFAASGLQSAVKFQRSKKPPPISLLTSVSLVVTEKPTAPNTLYAAVRGPSGEIERWELLESELFSFWAQSHPIKNITDRVNTDGTPKYTTEMAEECNQPCPVLAEMPTYTIMVSSPDAKDNPNHCRVIWRKLAAERGWYPAESDETFNQSLLRVPQYNRVYRGGRITIEGGRVSVVEPGEATIELRPISGVSENDWHYSDGQWRLADLSYAELPNALTTQPLSDDIDDLLNELESSTDQPPPTT